MYCDTFALIAAFENGLELEKWLLRLKATPQMSSGEPEEQPCLSCYEYEMSTCGIYSDNLS